MITLNDFMENDGLYYVADVMDVDGSGWVDKTTALAIIDQINKDDA